VVGKDARPTWCLLAVSHAAAAPANQDLYEALVSLGWRVHLIMPDRWRDGFNGRPFKTQLKPALAGCGRRVRVVNPGRPQRHAYLARLRPMVRQIRPDVAFVEEEPFSASAWQWGMALHRTGVPFGVQHAENLERRLPQPAPYFRRAVLARAGFVAARSPRAAELVTGIRAEFVPHPLPTWRPAPGPAENGGFVVGYAGRLVEAKGIRDLLAAVERLPDVRLLVVGDGPLRQEVQVAAHRTGRVEILTDVRHAMMGAVYSRMQVLVLPSRTTPTWTEQFGRVLVEALASGVPVIGSSSGEIPWVIEMTGGGLVVPEGDVKSLSDAICQLRDDPERRRTLAATGKQKVLSTFSVSAVAEQMSGLLKELLNNRSERRSFSGGA
jgi:glycosyltransferase involved in cell wall biosynthesis